MNIANTIFMIILLPACYFALKMNFSPIFVYWFNVIFFLTDNVVCLHYSHKYTGLPLRKILFEVYINTILGAILMFVIPYVVSLQYEEGLLRFFLVCSVSLFTSICVIYFYGLTPGMKKMVQSKLHILKMN